MKKTRATEHRRDRHTKRLSQHAIRHAGRADKVGRATGVSRSAAAHWTSDRVHPALRDAFAVLLRLDAHPEVSGRAFVEAAAAAVELSEIVLAETDVLTARGCYLMAHEDVTCMEESQAALAGAEAHAAALHRHGPVVNELADVIIELLYRGVDLHDEYRIARAAA